MPFELKTIAAGTSSDEHSIAERRKIVSGERKIPIVVNFDYTNVIGYAEFKDDILIQEGDEFSYSYVVRENVDGHGKVLHCRALSLVHHPAAAKAQREERS